MVDVLILAIETATGCGGVALTRGIGGAAKILAEFTLQPETTHSRRLLGSVATIMAGTGIGWNELDGIAVSQGPGSFTGLRIGMAAAQGIAVATGLPLVAVPTLDGLAAQVVPTELPLCCLLDARKQQVYAGFYHFAGAGWQRAGAFLVLSPDELVRRIGEPTLVVGPGVEACRSQLAVHPWARCVDAVNLHPRAATIGLCAGQRLLGKGSGETGQPSLLYVRASEAELNLRTMEVARQGAA